jgi:RNA polymerase sigma-70 factor, ECF subfamily
MKQPDNEQIKSWAALIRESDQNAFDCLFRALYPSLVHYALRYTRHKPAACDIVQDTFVTLWQKRSDIDPEQSVKSYLYRIVRNRSINWLHMHVNRSEPLTDEAETIIAADDHQPESNSDHIGSLEENFNEWIKDLPERQQEAFELSRFEGLDHNEIAGVMEVSPKTVNNHIVAALSTLRERYDLYIQNLNRAEES